MLRIGKTVGFLHEQGTALVLELRGKRALILDSDGFEREVFASELIELHGTSYDKHTPENPEHAKGMLLSRKEQKQKVSKQHQGTVLWEVDLHIEELTASISGWNSTDMLIRQMAVFKNKFRAAKEQRVNKLVVIHGVGEGVLKNEIRSFLMKQEQVEFHDADYSKYGKGATEIVFHPNW